MSMNGTSYEEYRGWYIAPGITMASQGIFEYNVYASKETYFLKEAAHEASSRDEAMAWVDAYGSESHIKGIWRPSQ